MGIWWCFVGIKTTKNRGSEWELPVRTLTVCLGGWAREVWWRPLNCPVIFFHSPEGNPDPNEISWLCHRSHGWPDDFDDASWMTYENYESEPGTPKGNAKSEDESTLMRILAWKIWKRINWRNLNDNKNSFVGLAVAFSHGRVVQSFAWCKIRWSSLLQMIGRLMHLKMYNDWWIHLVAESTSLNLDVLTRGIWKIQNQIWVTKQSFADYQA